MSRETIRSERQLWAEMCDFIRRILAVLSWFFFTLHQLIESVRQLPRFRDEFYECESESGDGGPTVDNRVEEDHRVKSEFAAIDKTESEFAAIDKAEDYDVGKDLEETNSRPEEPEFRQGGVKSTSAAAPASQPTRMQDVHVASSSQISEKILLPRRALTNNISVPYNCKCGSHLPRKWYAVAKGRMPGIYFTWEETEPLVKHFSEARHKSFKSRRSAQQWLNREGLQFPLGARHRVEIECLSVDLQGHKVYRCNCCAEVFCTNGYTQSD